MLEHEVDGLVFVCNHGFTRHCCRHGDLIDASIRRHARPAEKCQVEVKQIGQLIAIKSLVDLVREFSRCKIGGFFDVIDRGAFRDAESSCNPPPASGCRPNNDHDSNGDEKDHGPMCSSNVEEKGE